MPQKPTNDGGRPFVDRLRLDRWMRAPVEHVWAHLSEARLIQAWLPHGEVDPVPGGWVAMPVADFPARTGAVVTVRAPTLLEHTLGEPDGAVRWQLHPHHLGTRIELTQTANLDLAALAAGWHVLLDALDAALADDPGAPAWADLADHRAAYGPPVPGGHGDVVVDAAITVAASRAEVFAALVTPALLDRWLPATAVVEARVGGRYDLGWTGPRPTEIVELDPDRLVAYRWTDDTGQATVVRWRLADDPRSGTRVRLTHRGWDDHGGWREAPENLKDLLES